MGAAGTFPDCRVESVRNRTFDPHAHAAHRRTRPHPIQDDHHTTSNVERRTSRRRRDVAKKTSESTSDVETSRETSTSNYVKRQAFPLWIAHRTYEGLSSQSVNDHVLPPRDEAFSVCNSFVTHKECAQLCPIADHDKSHFDLIDPRT